MLSLCLLHLVGHIVERRFCSTFVLFDNLLRATYPRTFAKYLLHILGIDNLALYQEFSQLVVTFLMFGQNLLSSSIFVVDEFQHLVVDNLSGSFRIRTLELIFLIVVVADVRQSVAHTCISNHTESTLCGTLQVVHGTCRDMTCEEFLGSSTTQEGTHLVEHLLLCSDLSLFWHIPCSSKRLSTRHDAHLNQRISILAEPADGSMSSLMQGNRTLFGSSHHLSLLFQSADYSVYCIKEVLFAYGLLVVASSYQGCLVAHVSDIGTREARSLTCQEVYIHAIILFHRTKMHVEYCLTLSKVWQVDIYLTVETTSTQQCLIEHVGSIGSSQHDDTTISAEAIHFSKQRVESVFTLIVATHSRTLATRTTYGINLVDKDDTWRLFFSLVEHVAHTTSAHTHKHLYEVATAHREERYASFASHSLCQQGFTRSWRAHKQCSLWNLTTQIGIFARILQEVNNLLHLLFSPLLSSHILECDAQGVSLLIQFSFALADIKHAATASAAHATTKEPHEEEENENRREIKKDVQEVVAILFLVAIVNNLSALLSIREIFVELVA